ncbi:lymphocyte antigen 6D [Labrus mixtus]|uniref:lymphocyte antigen 6D n=1 Tax=Labrus mixtus TaxID=508554 RepID=UPI0029C0DC4E|nr:lymphocyte antigen 6D [Labrus mixtus]
MKVLLLTLLLLLCSTQVLSIRCFTCNSADDHCTVQTDCPNDHYCMVREHSGSVSRTCAEICTENNHTSCCEEDLCNAP